ncbi:MAG: septum formation initiator family protein [Syntrophobacteraceae bacterium]
MNRKIKRNNNQENKSDKGTWIKGVHIVRLLVCSLLGLNALLLYAIFFSSNGLQGYRNQDEQVRVLEEKILKLQQQNHRLFEAIQAFKSDPRSQEKLVRQELGWVRENEVILEFPEIENELRKKQKLQGKQNLPSQ